MLEAAVRAPDHGKLRPWRFLVVRGGARLELAQLYAEAALRREPGAAPDKIEKERAKPMRSPLTIGVVAKVTENHKIPVVEQVLSGGAAAMNILNAAWAMGFAAKWVTGANAYDPMFLQALGVSAPDQLLGFLQIGRPAGTVPAPERPDPGQFTTEWHR